MPTAFILIGMCFISFGVTLYIKGTKVLSTKGRTPRQTAALIPIIMGTLLFVAGVVLRIAEQNPQLLK